VKTLPNARTATNAVAVAPKATTVTPNATAATDAKTVPPKDEIVPNAVTTKNEPAGVVNTAPDAPQK
jgi:hypothetical protein